MLGLAPVRELAHALEDVLACLRDRNAPLDADTADLLFRTLDRLRELVAAATPGVDVPDAATAGLIAALRARAQAPDASEAAAPPSAPPPATAAAAPRVLLVDASPTVRLLSTMLLKEAGFEVDAIDDGQQALMLARTGVYQLVVTSVEVPGIRGLALAAALRASPACAHLPIIIMSSDDNPADKQQAAEIGVQAYLRKGSFGQQQLVQAAREVLRAR
jgi:two-component system sensor histidine kinase and response regulator WspE